MVVTGAVMHEHFELVAVGMSDFVVLVALSEDVLGRASRPFAGFALAYVAADEPRSVQRIRGSHASTDDALEKSVD